MFYLFYFLLLFNKLEIEPNNQELLTNSIYLTNKCQNVKIIEWRGSEINQSNISIIDDICNNSVINFEKSNNVNNQNFNWNISLIPINGIRSLNDKNRINTNKPLLGWTSHEINITFVLSNLDHNKFNEVLAHELYHSLSFYYKTYVDSSTDEELARKFTKFLGYN